MTDKGNFCKRCSRPLDEPYHVRGICDLAVMKDGRTVHASRTRQGGDLWGQPVAQFMITDEMRKQGSRRTEGLLRTLRKNG